MARMRAGGQPLPGIVAPTPVGPANPNMQEDPFAQWGGASPEWDLENPPPFQSGGDPNGGQYNTQPVPVSNGPDPVPISGGASGHREGVANAYKEFLKRDMTDADYMHWQGNDNYLDAIRNSPEAKAAAAGQSYTRTYDPMAGFEQGKLNNPEKNSPKYQFGRSMQEFGGWGRGNLQPLIDYHNKKYGTNFTVSGEDKIRTGIAGWGDVDIINGETEGGQWTPLWDQGGSGGTGIQPKIPGGGYGGGIFGGVEGGGGYQPSGGFGGEIEKAILRGLGAGESGKGSRFESIRENIERGRKAQTNQAMAAMGDRGLLGENGIVQGTEVNALNSIEDTIAPIWAQALRDAELGANEQTLGFVNAGTQYQGMVAGLALQHLEQNRLWNQFLAEHGLNREKVLHELQNGNIDQINLLLKMFLEASGVSRSGYV